MKVLYVEDNEINIVLLKHQLKEIDLDSAISADQALELLEEHTFDLFLIDINLGQSSMNGVELMKLIKNKEKYSKTPCYACTAYVGDEFEKKFLNEGFDKYYPKPVDYESLKSDIQLIKNLKG